MIIVKIKDGESIDSTLKKYKNKIRNCKQTEILRHLEWYDKPSVKKRAVIKKAIHVEKKYKLPEQY